jgi:hypothetical protein
MDSHEGPLMAAALARRVRDGAPAAQVTSLVAGTWRRVEASMAPIIGPAGVAALYKRSLLLAGRSHPWLVKLYDDGQSTVDVEALMAVLAQQESDAAALGGGELLETFYGLLSSLIGSTLTRRLLPFMWQSLEESVTRTSP